MMRTTNQTLSSRTSPNTLKTMTTTTSEHIGWLSAFAPCRINPANNLDSLGVVKVFMFCLGVELSVLTIYLWLDYHITKYRIKAKVTS